jgi:hypothetical protein
VFDEADDEHEVVKHNIIDEVLIDNEVYEVTM